MERGINDGLGNNGHGVLMRHWMSIFSGLTATFLLMADAVPVQAMSSKMSSRESYASCVSNPARIKMGSKIFLIQRSDQIRLAYLKSRQAGDLCHADQPLELRQWTADVSYDLLFDDIKNKFDKHEASLRLHVVHITPQTHKEFRTLNEAVNDLLRTFNTKPDNLPMEHGFYTWKYKNRPAFTRNVEVPPDVDALYRRHNVYISYDKDLLSPTGEPAIFACEMRFNENREIAFEDCWTQIWDGEVSYVIRSIITNSIPKEQWKELYRNILILRQSLLIGTEHQTPK